MIQGVFQEEFFSDGFYFIISEDKLLLLRNLVCCGNNLSVTNNLYRMNERQKNLKTETAWPCITYVIYTSRRMTGA